MVNFATFRVIVIFFIKQHLFVSPRFPYRMTKINLSFLRVNLIESCDNSSLIRFALDKIQIQSKPTSDNLSRSIF